MNRRTMLKWTATACAAVLAGPAAAQKKGFWMPPEWHPHERCFLALSAADGQHTDAEFDAVHAAQARIARAVARFEPVTALVRPHDSAYARDLLGPNVDLLPMEFYDLWARDTLPTFVHGPLGLTAVGWNFNVWGEKSGDDPGYDLDRSLAQRLAGELNQPFVRARIVNEGGAIETDGQGTLLTTETCLLNPNRNPGLSRREIEADLMRLTGCTKVVWLHGSETDEITDGHIDGVARFMAPGLVVAEISDDPLDPEYADLQENLRMLRAARDAQGRQFEIATVLRPRWDRMPAHGDHFAASYVNSCEANGGLVMPRFGDPERDEAARTLFARLRPDREIVQLDVDAVCELGGGIHCCTQQLPKI